MGLERRARHVGLDQKLPALAYRHNDHLCPQLQGLDLQARADQRQRLEGRWQQLEQLDPGAGRQQRYERHDRLGRLHRRTADRAPDKQWGPALPGAIFLRNVLASSPAWAQAYNGTSTTTATDYYNNVPYYCPAEAKKLQEWPDASAFDTYVDSLVPTGNTYHDIGMAWGARFMSPTGIFASENATTPGGADIQRHMIFMTDGDAVSAPCDYAAHGVAYWDQRTTTDVGIAANCASEYSTLDDQVNARFVALCTAVKNKNITLWVISFGSGSNTTTEARLSSCASTGKYFTARDSATLQTTFQSIANQISQLRLTK
jgi:hypothetical protein